LIEVVIPLVLVCMLVGVELIEWRFLFGPARRLPGTVYRAVLLCLITLTIVFVSAWRLSKSREFQLFGDMVARVETSSPVVALTFDDGPMPGFTDEILEILGEEGVNATFFVTARAEEQNLTEAQRIVAEGHELGNHSYSHTRMIGRSYSFVREEVERTDELIRVAGYDGNIHFRPPYGKRFILLPYYLSVTGRTTIFWDVEPESYPEIAADAETITSHVLDEARPGSIILLHVMAESRAETMQAVPAIIEGLQSRGYRFVTVSELLALDELRRVQ
jgi:peptidoglycan/xylan/chitin deacetylase (PgdA/CDA1 family)